jgi:urease accessory protein
MDIEKLFLLLQVNDAAFPIGSYTHSYGLETYIQQKTVSDAASAGRYIRQNLKAVFLYTELLAAALAYDAAAMRKTDDLLELEELLFAGKSPAELRDAAAKLGSRFVKTAARAAKAGGIFGEYTARTGKRVSHAVAYGVFCAACGIEKRSAMAAYLYAQAAAMVTNCVKSIPLSQTDGQELLAGLHPLFAELLEKLGTLDETDLCRSAPGLDIASMRHERLYSRLYIS